MTSQNSLKDPVFTIALPNHLGSVLMSSKAKNLPKNGITLTILDDKIVAINNRRKKGDRFLLFNITETSEEALLSYFKQFPDNTSSNLADTLTELLHNLGIHTAQDTVTTAPKKMGKVRHHFDKALIDMPFYVDFNHAKATAYWVASKKMVIKKGATLLMTPIVTQSGTLAYGTKYGEKLRADNQQVIAGNTTIADVTLQSVNEVGLFLYFGNTNSWQVLKNKDGQTLDELTAVK